MIKEIVTQIRGNITKGIALAVTGFIMGIAADLGKVIYNHKKEIDSINNKIKMLSSEFHDKDKTVRKNIITNKDGIEENKENIKKNGDNFTNFLINKR